MVAECPSSYKEAVNKPLLKKPGLNKEAKNNYRLVCNLIYLPKMIERVVAKRLDSFFQQQNLVEPVHTCTDAPTSRINFYRYISMR